MQGLRTLSVFATLLACAASAQADDLYSGSSTFLDLGGYSTPFRYPDGDRKADVGRYGVAFSYQWADDFSLELHGGYLTLDVDGEPQPVHQSSSGRYLGAMARYEGTEQDYLNFSAELSYTWQDVDSDGFQGAQLIQPSEFTWYETWAAAGPVLRLDIWRLSLGAYYQGFTGTETDSAPSRVLDFRAGRHLGAYLGVALYIEPNYSVGLMGTAGARDGVRLIFRRDF